MKKPVLPKINSLHYGGIWIAAGLVIGGVIPAAAWCAFGVFLRWAVILGAVILLAFAVLFIIEMRQDNGKVPYYEKCLKYKIPFDPEKQYAVIRSSICTGEKVAGFRNRDDGHFTDVMLIRSPEDEQRFKEIYGLDKVKVEY